MTMEQYIITRKEIFSKNRIQDTVHTRYLYSQYKVKGYSFSDIIRGFNKLGLCGG